MKARYNHRLVRSLVLFTCVTLLSIHAATAGEAPHKSSSLPAAFAKQTPETVQDLRDIQTYVQTLVEKVTPCVVGLSIGSNQGSGVIINKEGLVLTAGHVSGDAGRDVIITLSNGRKVKGKTLGGNRDIDSGMIKIVDKGPWPHADMGKSTELKRGQWCLAIGHPGGYKSGRTPVVRLGRVLDHGGLLVRTDCPLVGGDSGGPLFDMQGRVVGVHSRINTPLTTNIHVPVDTYRDTWARLESGEVWGGEPYIGVQIDEYAAECRILEVYPDSPASRAGLKVNDVLVAFDGTRINTFGELRSVLLRRRPGIEVPLSILREGETLTLKVRLGKRPS
jgi:serine protease Do